MARRKHPKLVTQYLEDVSRIALEEHGDALARFIGRRTGVYALYRKGKLYYAGLASSLRSRLKHHLKDKHSGKWDTFSVYLTIGDSHLRELESLILRVMQPPGNSQLGKFSGAEDIWRKFSRAIAEKQRRDRDRIFGIEAEEDEVSHLIARAIRIRASRKGRLVKAKLRRDLSIRWNHKIYKSPSAAAKAVCKRNQNGWSFWHYERSPGYWVPIDELRS